MMKLVLALALVATALADVSHLSSQTAQILRQDSDITPEGNYQWAYETSNGIAAQEQGSLRAAGPEAAIVAQGNFAWTSPEGVPVAISYVADENGYQPQGDSLPVPPPVPVAIQKALAWIAAHPEKPEQQVQYGRLG